MLYKPPVINFLSKARGVTMNPDNADAERLQMLKKLHTLLGTLLRKAAA